MNIITSLDGLPNGVALSFAFPESQAERKDLDRVAGVLRKRGIALDVDGGRFATTVLVWRGLTTPCQGTRGEQRPYSDLLRSVNQLERQ